MIDLLFPDFQMHPTKKAWNCSLIAYFRTLALVNRFSQINTNSSRPKTWTFRILFSEEIYQISSSREQELQAQLFISIIYYTPFYLSKRVFFWIGQMIII